MENGNAIKKLPAIPCELLAVEFYARKLCCANRVLTKANVQYSFYYKQNLITMKFLSLVALLLLPFSHALKAQTMDSTYKEKVYEMMQLAGLEHNFKSTDFVELFG